MRFPTIVPLWCGLAALLIANCAQAATTNLVANGSFEDRGPKPDLPADWSVSGNRAIQQRLTLDAGRDRQHAAKLECTVFAGDGPDFHAMICQTGKVGVRRGQWYRLTFWAKGAAIRHGSVEVGLSNTRTWENTGLAEAFSPPVHWERFEFMFRARSDLPAAISRLQFWFKGTGTLWLDDVVLAESEDGQQWFPQLTTADVKNFIPNSSFECGAANWGSFTYGLSGWAGNLYRLEGELDGTVTHHGRHSLKITLNPRTLPVFYFDYYEPVRQPVRRVLVANQGWFRVKPGEKLTLSAFMRADAEGVVAQMAANEASGRLLRQSVTVGTTWQRQVFTFTPQQPFLFIAAGLDLEASQREAAVLWLDAIQLERGGQATAYAPRHPVECFAETGVSGNTFTNVKAGAAFTVRTFNDTPQSQTVHGDLTITDFFDRKVFAQHVSLNVPGQSAATAQIHEACKDQRGFFLAKWTTPTTTQQARCAILDPLGGTLTDSPFGFNHAYPWDFLVQLARQAGVLWWRDWSAQWQIVEAQRGQFTFAIPDQQIQRVQSLDGEVEVLLPFPSASWSTSARPDEVKKAAGENSYLRQRMPVAYAPKDLNDFGAYAARVVQHYRTGQTRRVTTYQILNEPVYTSYALPRQFGYTLEDYVQLLGVAFRAMKAADPQCRIVGGISANLSAGLTREFVTKGGLNSVDVFDLHMYDAPRAVETYDEAFQSLEELMRAHGGPKPVWITEWGCYADDDPPSVPLAFGDATMNRCRWPSERAATEHIVKFATIAFAHGLRKIFFHAGTCGTINGADAGGVLFEYGGAPRKMLPGVAAFTRLLGVPDEYLKTIRGDSHVGYLFRSQGRAVAIAWSNAASPPPLALKAGLRAYDIMGNELPARAVALSGTPAYLVGDNPASLADALSR